MSRTLVIGAGMAGLTAARRLVGRGGEVLVVDKGRAVGGRMATRRVGDAAFDHGAQHVSARSPDFRRAMEGLITAGVARIWFASASDTRADRAVEPRHGGVGGMRRIPEHLADGLDVRTGVAIAGLSRDGGEWIATTAEGVSFRAGAVVLTAPLPQAIDLLDRAALPVEDRLRAVGYDACLAVMATLDRPSGLPDGHLALDGDVAWIADNHHKGVSAVPAITIHSSPGFAERHFDADPGAWAEALATGAARHLGGRVTVVRTHRWRFSMPRRTFDDGAVEVAGGLVLAGEVFAGARVEGAFLSGTAAADLVGG